MQDPLHAPVEGKHPETMSPPPPPRFSVVFVLGVARCGSTLLGRLLDMHSRVLCVGEVLRTGYRLKGRVLRPAMVRVTRAS